MTKCLLTALLIILAIVEIVYPGIIDGDDLPETNIYPVDYVTPFVFLITYIW